MTSLLLNHSPVKLSEPLYWDLRLSDRGSYKQPSAPSLLIKESRTHLVDINLPWPNGRQWNGRAYVTLLFNTTSLSPRFCYNNGCTCNSIATFITFVISDIDIIFYVFVWFVPLITTIRFMSNIQKSVKMHRMHYNMIIWLYYDIIWLFYFRFKNYHICFLSIINIIVLKSEFLLSFCHCLDVRVHV